MSQTTIPLKILQEQWDELQKPYSKAMVCTCGKLIKIETKLESKNVE